MAQRILVGDGALTATADALRSEVTALRRTVDDLDGYLRTLSSAWSGAASVSFGRAYASWALASGAVRDDLAAVARLVDLADANIREATRAGVRAWDGPARSAAVVAMAAAGAAWVDVDVGALTGGARAVVECQRALAGAADAFAVAPGIAGDDAALAGWRARYDALARAATGAVDASATVLAGVADGLVGTAAAYVAADQGAAPGSPTQSPPVRPAGAPTPSTTPPPSTGPGALGPVPTWLAEYVPDVDVRALDAAAEEWRRLGQSVARSTIGADRAMSAVLAANRGPVFDAARRYWDGVYLPCGPDTLLTLAGNAPSRLAAHLETLSGAVRRAQSEMLGAVERSTPSGVDETRWDGIRLATIGLGFLGPVGRAGVALVSVEELVLRAQEARRRYLADVDAAVAEFDRSLEDRLERAVAGARRVEDVSAALTGASTVAASSFPALTIDRKQIEKKYDSHARDLGISLPRGRAGFEAVQQAVESIYSAPNTRRVAATLRGQPVIANYDLDTSKVVLQTPDGSFLSAWTLSEKQLFNLVYRYSLGG